MNEIQRLKLLRPDPAYSAYTLLDLMALAVSRRDFIHKQVDKFVELVHAGQIISAVDAATDHHKLLSELVRIEKEIKRRAAHNPHPI